MFCVWHIEHYINLISLSLEWNDVQNPEDFFSKRFLEVNHTQSFM